MWSGVKVGPELGPEIASHHAFLHNWGEIKVQHARARDELTQNIQDQIQWNDVTPFKIPWVYYVKFHEFITANSMSFLLQSPVDPLGSLLFPKLGSFFILKNLPV